MLMGHKNNRAKVLDTNNPVSLEKDIGTPQVWDPISGRVREAKELFSPRTIVLTNIGSVKGKFRYFFNFSRKSGIPLNHVLKIIGMQAEKLRVRNAYYGRASGIA